MLSERARENCTSPQCPRPILEGAVRSRPPIDTANLSLPGIDVALAQTVA